MQFLFAPLWGRWSVTPTAYKRRCDNSRMSAAGAWPGKAPLSAWASFGPALGLLARSDLQSAWVPISDHPAFGPVLRRAAGFTQSPHYSVATGTMPSSSARPEKQSPSRLLGRHQLWPLLAPALACTGLAMLERPCAHAKQMLGYGPEWEPFLWSAVR